MIVATSPSTLPMTTRITQNKRKEFVKGNLRKLGIKGCAKKLKVSTQTIYSLRRMLQEDGEFPVPSTNGHAKPAAPVAVAVKPTPKPKPQPKPRAQVKEKLEPEPKKKPSREEVEAMWAAYRWNKKDREARNKLVEHYLPIVNYNGSRLWAKLPDSVEQDDLVSAGIFGLLDALNAFDPDRGVKFETYCVPRIRGAMLDELRKMDWVPRLVRSRTSRLNEALRTLEIKLGRSPSAVEMAEHMELSVSEVERMASDSESVNIVSLSKKRYETDSFKDIEQIDILEDKRIEDPAKRSRKMALLRMLTRGLNRNERLIIILYYLEEQTMKHIGETLDLSESRVSQMHSALIVQLRKKHKRVDAWNLLSA